jgi:hypothetical protein
VPTLVGIGLCGATFRTCSTVHVLLCQPKASAAFHFRVPGTNLLNLLPSGSRSERPFKTLFGVTVSRFIMRPSGKANHDAEFYEHTLISIDSRQQQPMDLRLVGSRSCQLLIPILLDIHASIWLVAGLMRSKAITCKSTTKLVQRHPMS